MITSYNLQRFLDAQEHTYDVALSEIFNGEKRSHWIWYIFPQLKGLGCSYNSDYYGLDGVDEAKAYYNHPILRSRLIEITEALLKHKDKTVFNIMPKIDVKKVLSCATIFHYVSHNPVFQEAIDIINLGDYDKKTVELIRKDIKKKYDNLKHDLLILYRDNGDLFDDYFNSLTDYDDIYRELQRGKGEEAFQVSDICWPDADTYLLFEEFEIKDDTIEVAVSDYRTGPPDSYMISFESVPLDIVKKIYVRLNNHIERTKERL